MVCLGLKPGAAGWKAQTNPLSYSINYTISWSPHVPKMPKMCYLRCLSRHVDFNAKASVQVVVHNHKPVSHLFRA